MNPLKSASTSSLVVGVSITSTSGLPSDGFTGMDDDNSDVLTFFQRWEDEADLLVGHPDSSLDSFGRC